MNLLSFMNLFDLFLFSLFKMLSISTVWRSYFCSNFCSFTLSKSLFVTNASLSTFIIWFHLFQVILQLGYPLNTNENFCPPFLYSSCLSNRKCFHTNFLKYILICDLKRALVVLTLTEFFVTSLRFLVRPVPWLVFRLLETEDLTSEELWWKWLRICYKLFTIELADK